MAAKRAAVKASRIQSSDSAETRSGWRCDASTAPTPANGSAKKVCGSFTKLA
jgi:hypothetical protein